jgi:hypothetical protein
MHKDVPILGLSALAGIGGGGFLTYKLGLKAIVFIPILWTITNQGLKQLLK